MPSCLYRFAITELTTLVIHDQKKEEAWLESITSLPIILNNYSHELIDLKDIPSVDTGIAI